MASFYEFVSHSEHPSNLALSSSERSSSTEVAFNTIKTDVTSLALSTPAIPSNDAEQFGQDIAQLVTSNSFLKELSEAIQPPKPNETEDEFVSRCKLALIKLIDGRMAKK